MDLDLSNIVESIIFAAEQPVKIDMILDILFEEEKSEKKEDKEGKEEKDKKAKKAEAKKKAELRANVQEILDQLAKKYQDEPTPFEIRSVAGGFQFFTKRAYYPYVRKAVLQKNKKRLSRSAIETLSIIAYRQPITKAEVEFIRGVNCDYTIQKLLEKQLVSITGRAEAPGRPLLYATSAFFMQYFGLSDMNGLPKLKEFEELEGEHLALFKQYQAEKESSNEQEKSKPESEEGTVLARPEESGPQTEEKVQEELSPSPQENGAILKPDEEQPNP